MVTALIQFDQGGPGPAGEAFIGTASSLVTVTNDDNTDVTEWTITLLDVPPDSAVVTGVLATAVSSTPTASFTPDVPGSYRVLLSVTDGADTDEDIRVFGIRNARGIIIPPYQDLPQPLPVLGSGDPGEKPDEQNYGGQTRGWSGDTSSGQMEQFMRTYADLPLQVLTGVSVSLQADGVPYYVVDLDTVGGDSTVTLPTGARPGQVIYIEAFGSTAGRVVTVQASGGGTIVPWGTVDIPQGGGGTFVLQSGDNWRVIGTKKDIYERTIVGGVESTDQTSFVTVGTTHLDLDNFVNIQEISFQAVIETTNAADAAEVRLFNVTTATVVASSTLQSTSLTPELVTADITGNLASGSNIYEAQLRLASTGAPNRATCKQAQILIDWVQV